jgi:transcriptional regulator with XRE-family HTH domain
MGVVVKLDGSRLHRRRLRRGLIVQELGKTAGISPSTI